jgi:hypothetical protein
MPAASVALWHSGRAGQAPADHGRLDSASGFVVAPRAIDETAGERQLIGAAVILAQNLHRLIRRRVALAIELCETPFARCHSTSLHDGRLPAVSRQARIRATSPRE